MDNQFEHEARRLSRFEPGQVSSVSSDGTINTNTADRGSDRTQTGRSSGVDLDIGFRVLMVSAGDCDMSSVIGVNPWICH